MSRTDDEMNKPDKDPARDDPAHNAWFAAQVRAAIDDPRLSIAHHVVMAEVQALIDKKRTEGKGAHGQEKTESR
jgi:hypothetical protein